MIHTLWGRTAEETGLVHFAGVGGSGMSGLAAFLARWGFAVQGSDLKTGGAVLERLRKEGVRVFVGHDAAHVEEASVVVLSTAVKAENPERAAAEARALAFGDLPPKGVRVVHRSDVLGALMASHQHGIAVAGTHGKTTTTALVYHLFAAADVHPSVVNGGVIQALGESFAAGEGTWFVAEADESDGSFTNLKPQTAIVTNIDPEHLEHFGSFEGVVRAFEDFLRALPVSGTAVLCADHGETRALAERFRGASVRTYGVAAADGSVALVNGRAPDAVAANIRPSVNEAGMPCLLFDMTLDGEVYKDILLNTVGTHNVSNALGAMLAAQAAGVSVAQMRKGLADFGGVGRRFTRVGAYKGAVVVDDYAHHPVEVQATLAAARQAFGNGRIVAVLQPHRFTRLRDLMDGFAASTTDADVTLVAPVYAAGETALEGVSHDVLADKMRDVLGGERVRVIACAADVRAVCDELGLGAGDAVMCLGAGSITDWAREIVG